MLRSKADSELRFFLSTLDVRTRMTSVGLVAQSDDLCWVYDWNEAVFIDEVDDERRRVIKDTRHDKPRIDIRDARHYDALLIYWKARKRYIATLHAIQQSIVRANPGCEEGGRSLLVSQHA